MNDRDLLPERLAARHLAEEAPGLTAASADALRAGLAARVDTLRHAALAASRAGVPPLVIAHDSHLPAKTVRGWIATERCVRH